MPRTTPEPLEENPLDSAMARALSRRPEEVAPTRRRPLDDGESFQHFGPPIVELTESPATSTSPSSDRVEPPLQLGDDPDEPVGFERR